MTWFHYDHYVPLSGVKNHVRSCPHFAAYERWSWRWLLCTIHAPSTEWRSCQDWVEETEQTADREPTFSRRLPCWYLWYLFAEVNVWDMGQLHIIPHCALQVDSRNSLWKEETCKEIPCNNGNSKASSTPSSINEISPLGIGTPSIATFVSFGPLWCLCLGVWALLRQNMTGESAWRGRNHRTHAGNQTC